MRWRPSQLRLRESARALIIDPDGNVLLVHFDWPGLDVQGGFWATPGGGVEPGETRFAALQRELREEVGLQIDALGPELWTQTATFAMTGWDGQVDHVHLCRTAHFDPVPEFTTQQLVAENVREIRWWSMKDVEVGCATFAPRRLPAILRQLRENGVPTAPLTFDGF